MLKQIRKTTAAVHGATKCFISAFGVEVPWGENLHPSDALRVHRIDDHLPWHFRYKQIEDPFLQESSIRS